MAFLDLVRHAQGDHLLFLGLLRAMVTLLFVLALSLHLDAQNQQPIWTKFGTEIVAVLVFEVPVVVATAVGAVVAAVAVVAVVVVAAAVVAVADVVVVVVVAGVVGVVVAAA